MQTTLFFLFSKKRGFKFFLSFQLHQFKPGQSATGIQALTNAVTIAQVLPSRTQQAMVYSASGGGGGGVNTAAAAHFTPAPRLTVASGAQQGQVQRQTINTTRPVVSIICSYCVNF